MNLTDLDFPAVLTTVVLVSTAIGALITLWRLARRLMAFLDEVLGEPAAFGRPAKPGLIERLDGVAAAQAQHTEQLDRLIHEVFPNSGSSLRDAVDRLEARVNGLAAPAVVVAPVSTTSD